MHYIALYDCKNGQVLLLTRENPTKLFEAEYYLSENNDINIINTIKQFELKQITYRSPLLEDFKNNQIQFGIEYEINDNDYSKLMKTIKELKIR